MLLLRLGGVRPSRDEELRRRAGYGYDDTGVSLPDLEVLSPRVSNLILAEIA